MKLWRIDTSSQTLVLASKGGVPFVCYWGSPLPSDEDLGTLAISVEMDVSGGVLDVNHPITLCPVSGDSYPGQVGLIAQQDNATYFPRFELGIVDQSAEEWVANCHDENIDLTLKCQIQNNVLTWRSEAVCKGDVNLNWLSAPVLPLPHQATETIEIHGKWCGEFQLTPMPIHPGARLRESVTGRTGHETFPGLIVPSGKAAYGFHYGWSGGHRMITEELPDGRRQVIFGHARDGAPKNAQSMQSSTLSTTFSQDGLNGIGAIFQSHLRDHVSALPRPLSPRKVHYNCWEAIYFDHDLESLCEIADRAAKLGAERFVLDDGWFGKRDDDTSSLGDWTLDRRKYPDGLRPLIDHIKGLGMDFGIWFEPEMVNPDSELYRAHPEWVLGHRDQTLGRQQLVLDIAQNAVQDYLFDAIDLILKENDISYVKWDHNRVLPFVDHSQTEALYNLLSRLRCAHPSVEFESCSSGGGRIDFGILQQTARVWLSDSNDALTRFEMQRNAALFLPAALTGSHVGPRHCHTSGRVLPMSFRAWVAASRHMGFEMDPRELSSDEAETLRSVTKWYKENRDWMHKGQIIRLPQDDPSTLAEMTLGQLGEKFVAMFAQMAPRSQGNPRPHRFSGLEPDAIYNLRLCNPEDAARVSRGPVALREGNLTLSGTALMAQGINLPLADPATLWVVEGKRL